MTYDEIKKQLDSEYDRVIRETLAKLKKKKPLTKHKLAELLFKANKAYWAARLALLDSEAVDSADRFAMSLAVPYATAAQTFSDRVRNIYAGYQSAFDLTQKDAKELLDKVVYDRTIAESLQKIAEDMPDGEDKTRILAEISAPAYRYRLQRAEQLAEQAKEVCHNIARGEIDADRKFLQTETEKAYNITVDEALRGTPADAILDEILPEPIQLRFNEMPKASEPVQDFTPTEDKGVLDSFSLTSTKHVSEITETDWKGRNFSDSVWNNTDKLAQEIKQVLIEGELTGKSEADMAAKIVERFEVGMHAARRVVRTESNYCTNQAELKGMKDAGFDEYEFISLGEEAEDVCRVCDDLDGQRFKIADAVVGVNCPPMHPFCRCKVTTPQETEEDIQREIDERIDSWNIPEGMSLDEFIDRVNNGELEKIRAEQDSAEESAEKSVNSAEDNSLKMLTGGDNGGIMKDIAKNTYSYHDIPVTQDTIDNVPFVEVEGFTKEQNEALQNAQKEILIAVKDLPPGTEAGAIYCVENGKFERVGEIVIGEYGGHSVNLPSYDRPFITIHNHPDGKTLSPSDVNKLIGQPNMVIAATIGNNANSFMLQPRDNVDMLGFISYASTEIEKLDNQKDNLSFDDYAQRFESIWKGGEKYGIKYTQISNNS